MPPHLNKMILSTMQMPANHKQMIILLKQKPVHSKQIPFYLTKHSHPHKKLPWHLIKAPLHADKLPEPFENLKEAPAHNAAGFTLLFPALMPLAPHSGHIARQPLYRRDGRNI